MWGVLTINKTDVIASQY